MLQQGLLAVMCFCGAVSMASATSLASQPALFLRGMRRGGACLRELKQAEPKASRSAACTACDEFRTAHEGSEYVTPNGGLCPKCYSMVSACDETQFAWSCYDANDQFDNFQKNTADSNLDEPSEMVESFKNQDPEECSGV
eukprot:TRINITY_DN2504_c0_g1_i2.p1 TRINITY_DN2504_c0_g1~~TRINITY_DN2504_c0_g1_i2.p1  ORF type:complete len:141 (-),score=23.70 TRINITY_DN2504_c0_g1_i2:94-516(-)